MQLGNIYLLTDTRMLIKNELFLSLNYSLKMDVACLNFSIIYRRSACLIGLLKHEICRFVQYSVCGCLEAQHRWM